MSNLARDVLRAFVAELRRDPVLRGEFVAALVDGDAPQKPIVVDDVARARARRALARHGIAIPRKEKV